MMFLSRQTTTSFNEGNRPLVPSVSYTGGSAGRDIREIFKEEATAVFGKEERAHKSCKLDDVATWCGKLCLQSMITFEGVPIDPYSDKNYRMFFARLQSRQLRPTDPGYAEQVFYIAAAYNLSRSGYGGDLCLVDRFSRFVDQYQEAFALFERVTSSGFGLSFRFGSAQSSALQGSEPDAVETNHPLTDQGGQSAGDENH